MALFKCKMCGGELVLTPGSPIAVCEYCNSRQTVPSADNEKMMTLFARANRLRISCEFDKASGVYEALVADFPEEAEAYWGLVLCKFGIEYVDDPATGKKVPTCHRSSFSCVLDDENFEQVLKYADAAARKVYTEEAQQIENIRKGILELSAKADPYDIFICYKETDAKGQRTLDSVLAQDLYDVLTARNYRVFFSRISLEDKLGQEYEPYIFAALNSAKIMLVVGADYEHFNAVWVKNEWGRYLKLMESQKDKHLIPCYKGIDAYDMPQEFAKLQAQDLGKVGATQDLLRGIEKLIGSKTAHHGEAAPNHAKADAAAAAPLLQHAFLFLEDEKWEDAKKYFEQALDVAPDCAEAYLGEMMAELEVRDKEALAALPVAFDTNPLYKMVLRFGNDSLRQELAAALEAIAQKAAAQEANVQKAAAQEEKKGFFASLSPIKKAAMIIAPLLLLAIVCVLLWLKPSTLQPGTTSSDTVASYVTVPRVVGKAKNIAITNLLAAGLAEPKVITEHSNLIAEGNVIKQSIAYGTEVQKGTILTLTVSLGAQAFEMPDVCGMTKEEAYTLLTQKGIIVYCNYVQDDSIPEDTVTHQNITQGAEVRWGTSVTLTVSTGKEMVILFDVSNRQKESAIYLLERQGFTVTVEERHDDNVKAGLVISQAPLANTNQIKGIEVVIVVSKGPEILTVPSVSGKTQEAAIAELEKAGFQATIQTQSDSEIPVNTVIKQSPEAGTSQEKGSAITLWVSSGIGYPLTIEEGDFIYTAYSDKTAQITSYLGSATTLTLPEKVKEYSVTSIGDRAFNECFSLKSVVIPGSVTSIGDNAFCNCISLKSIVIPDSVTNIGAGVFSYCTGLTSVVIPDGVTSIGDRAFRSCYSLTSIVIPDSVTFIGDEAFSGCTGLTSIAIPGSVTSINTGAFSGCTGLTSIVIPDSVAFISQNAFHSCPLQTVYFGREEQKELFGAYFPADTQLIVQ